MAPTRKSRLGSLIAKRTTQLLVMATLLNMTLPTCFGLEQMQVLSGETIGRRLAENSTDDFGAEVVERVATKEEAEEEEKSAKLNLPSTAAEDRLFCQKNHYVWALLDWRGSSTSTRRVIYNSNNDPLTSRLTKKKFQDWLKEMQNIHNITIDVTGI